METLRTRVSRYYSEINPITGKGWTDREIAAKLGIHKSTASSIRRTLGIWIHQPPQIPDNPLPENARDFFLGMAFGEFSAVISGWPGREEKYLVASTLSVDPERRGLLSGSLESWGDVRESSSLVKVYLNPDQFNFFLSPPDKLAEKVNKRFLRKKRKYTPFLAGLLAARASITENGARLDLKNRPFLERIYNFFECHYGISMGRFTYRKDTGSAVIVIDKFGEVVGARLAGEKSVRELPFYKKFAQLGEEIVEERNEPVFTEITDGFNPFAGKIDDIGFFGDHWYNLKDQVPSGKFG